MIVIKLSLLSAFGVLLMVIGVLLMVIGITGLILYKAFEWGYNTKSEDTKNTELVGWDHE
jgi:hypothetical protein